MRRTWVWDPETRTLVERTAAPAASVDAPMVHGDFKPVDVGGIVIEDRGALRRYIKANNLAPYEPAAVKAARDRIAKAARVERKQGVIDAYEHERNKARARSRFG